MRRLLAACGAAAVSLAVVVPLAHADPADNNHKMNWWTPYNQQGDVQPATADDGAQVSGTDQVVTVRVDFPDGIKGWQVVVQPEAGGTPSTCAENYVPSQSGGAYPNHVYVSCPWDTTRAVDRTLDQPTPASQAPDMYHYDHNWHLNDHGASVNGKYAIEVKAFSAAQSCLLGCTYGPSVEYDLFQDYNANPQRWREVYVTNGVSDPTGVAAGYDAGSGNVNVTWAPNPEPDITYLVQEKVGAGNWAAIATAPAGTTNYVRSIGQPGKYQYQVAAQRPAPTANNGSATTTSHYVAAQAVTVAAVSPPPTAAGAGSAGGSPNAAPGAAPAADGPTGYIDHSGDNGVVTPAGGPTPTTAAGSHVAGSAKGTPGGSHATGSKSNSGGAAANGEDEGEGPDTGFSSTLPYQQDGATDGLGSGDSESPESMSKLVNVPRPQDARALLIPLAGALAMFVLAAQGMYLLRRRTPATAGGLALEDDFDDWIGY